MRPAVFGNEAPKHNVEHYIETIPESPVCSKSRKLAPDRFKAAKDEIDYILQ